MLKIKNLNINLENKKQILKNINFEIKKEELVGIVGESGCGKTTLIKAISSFCDENIFNLSGEIFFENKNLLEIKKRERKKICTRNMSIILQDSINTLNPYEKIGTQLNEEYKRVYKNKEEREKNIIKDLESMGLKNIDIILNSFPSGLSGGMKQRISIILALCNKNIKLLLADEPTTSLDTLNQFNFIKLLKEICEKKKISLIYVSHDIRLLSQICERIIVMKDGKILEDETSQNILKNPRNKYTKLLIEAFNFFEN